MDARSVQDGVVQQLVALLTKGQAHVTLEDAVADFPAAQRGVRPEGLPYSAWQLVEHLRIAQRDIVDFSNPPAGGYQAKEWPKAYWPEAAEPPSESSWQVTLAAIEADRERFVALLQQPEVDLLAPFAWGEGQNLLREALLIADHSAYHVGELVVLRRLLGCWR